MKYKIIIADYLILKNLTEDDCTLLIEMLTRTNPDYKIVMMEE